MLDKLKDYLEDIQGIHKYNISFWGNDYTNSLLLNYDFFDSENRLNDVQFIYKQNIDFIFVVGALTKIQVEKLIAYYNSFHKNKPKVIWIHGSIELTLLNKSEYACTHLDKLLPVNYEYKKYPINISELVSAIQGLKE